MSANAIPRISHIPQRPYQALRICCFRQAHREEIKGSRGNGISFIGFLVR
jgi:hypothetical protein